MTLRVTPRAPPAPVGPPASAAQAGEFDDRELAQMRAELLDSKSWDGILETFGRTMKLAVALTDADGNLLGPCHNPQPVWTLARGGPRENENCPFCLPANSACHAVADALASGKVTYADDPTGLAHAAIPLILGTHRLGALIAGQCFSQYPQPLALRRLARQTGASPQTMWDMAVRQVPVSHATLRLYADLLSALGKAFLGQLHGAILDRKLHQSDERYRLMIEESKDRALLTVDGAGRLTSWNPGAERLFGFTAAEIAGADYSRLFTPEDVISGVPAREIQRAAQSGWTRYEGQQVRRDGARFISETVIARLGQGESLEYGFLLHDVTEARKASEVSLEAQKLESIGVLAGGIAHDFNNLLTGILGNLSLAMVELPPEDRARPLLEIAERASLKAASLIRQLLSYAGKGAMSVTRFDLSSLVSEILPLIETSIPRTVRLELNLPAGLPWIVADASELQQIVMNLVINGAEALGHEAGAVRVTTGVARDDSSDDSGEAPCGGVFLDVSDSGSGMDEATRLRIFDPFFTTKFTGRGLGLAAVSGIVRRLKARMTVESSPGKGSTFRIVFRGVPAQATVPEIAAESAPLALTGAILVVDDDSDVRAMVRAVLEQYGYSVLTAENGAVAVDVFRDNADRIAVVVMDLTMPVMNGSDAFCLMNGIRPDIPVIISSGYAEVDVREQFSAALAGVIQKPYTVGRLRDKIAEVLMARKAAKPRTLGSGGH